MLWRWRDSRISQRVPHAKQERITVSQKRGRQLTAKTWNSEQVSTPDPRARTPAANLSCRKMTSRHKPDPTHETVPYCPLGGFLVQLGCFFRCVARNYLLLRVAFFGLVLSKCMQFFGLFLRKIFPSNSIVLSILLRWWAWFLPKVMWSPVF